MTKAVLVTFITEQQLLKLPNYRKLDYVSYFLEHCKYFNHCLLCILNGEVVIILETGVNLFRWQGVLSIRCTLASEYHYMLPWVVEGSIYI